MDSGLSRGEAGRSVVLTLIMIAVAASVVSLHGKWKANKWMECLDPGCRTAGAQEETAETSKLPTVPVIGNLAPPHDGAALSGRLNAQLEDVRRRADYHLQVTRDFYVNYYYSLTMALFVGAAAAILLFFISQTGWAAAKPWGVAAFIVTTTATASFTAFPLLYSQQDNIEQNKELYLQHRALEAEILSYGVTLEPSDRSKFGLATRN